MANPTFKLRFNCQLKDIWRNDAVYIKTKEDRFNDEGYPDYVIATLLNYKQVTCATTCQIWEYTFEATTALPAGVSTIQECDVEGIRLHTEANACCVVSGSWVDDEIHLLRADGEVIVIAAPDISCYGYPGTNPATW